MGNGTSMGRMGCPPEWVDDPGLASAVKLVPVTCRMFPSPPGACAMRQISCRRSDIASPSNPGLLNSSLFFDDQPTRFRARSTARHACRVLNVRTRIADEHFSVRHLDLAERPGVERRVGRKQTVQ